jgi:hypothetical protein
VVVAVAAAVAKQQVAVKEFILDHHTLVVHAKDMMEAAVLEMIVLVQPAAVVVQVLSALTGLHPLVA